jgi:non-ribosomal peptide synthetase component F
MFVNMIAMRNYPEPRKGFQEFLAEVKENSLGGLENQDYPFDLLVFKLGAGTDISRHPLFDVVFALQNFNPLPHKNRETAEPQPAVIPYQYKKEYEMGHKTSKFDLELVAVEIGKKIQLNFDYRTRLFKRETIEGMSRHFLNILNEVIIKPVIKIADINMLTPEEREPLKEIIKKAPGKLEANFNF